MRKHLLVLLITLLSSINFAWSQELPFELSSNTGKDAVWYMVSMTATSPQYWYTETNGTQLKKQAGSGNTVSSLTLNENNIDNYLFCFLGDSEGGYKIYAKKAQKFVGNTSDNTAANQAVGLSESGVSFRYLTNNATRFALASNENISICHYGLNQSEVKYHTQTNYSGNTPTFTKVSHEQYETYRCSSFRGLPVLYPTAVVEEYANALGTAEESTKLEALRSCTNGRYFALSTYGRSTISNPYYIYRRSNLSNDSYFATAVLSTAAPTAIFALEYISGQGYKLRNVSADTDNYLAPIVSGSIKHTDAEGAGIYTFEYAGTSNSCSIKDINNSTSYPYIHEASGRFLTGWGAYAPSTNGNAGSRWEISPAGCVTIHIVAPEELDIQREYTQYYIGEDVTINAPNIDNYVVDQASVTAHHGDVVTFTYSLRSYDITYTYTDAETQAEITSHSYTLAYGAELPTVEVPEGYMVLTQLEGTVEGERTYTIVCLNLNSTDQPDPDQPEKPTKVNLTYQFVGPDGTVWYEKNMGEVNNGEAYPAHGVTIPAGVTATQPTGTLNTMESALTLQIPCTTSFKLKFADSYSHISQWYGVTITNNKTPFHYEAGDTYMTLSGSASMENKYLFALVGNPFAGFKFYNKAAGDGKILSSDDPATGTGSNTNTGQYRWPVMMDEASLPEGYNTHWDLTVNGAGYFMSRHGETGYHLNSRADSGNGGSVLAYWNNTGEGSRVYFAPEGIEVTTTFPETATPEANKIYRIYSVRSKGYMIYEDASHNIMKTNEKTNDFSQLWVVENSTTGGAYTLRNAETGRFVVAPTGNNAQVVTQTATAPLYFISKDGVNDSDNKPYYGIGGNSTDTGNNWLNTNTSNMKVIGYSLGDDVGSGWVFEEADDYTLEQIKAHVKANSPYATLTSGNYYRLANKLYPERYLYEDCNGNGGLKGSALNIIPQKNSTIWKITGDETNGYKFQNVFTQHYVKDQTSWNAQVLTSQNEGDAMGWKIDAVEVDDFRAPEYAIYRGTNYALHCASTQTVLTWTQTNEKASYWNLEPVSLTSDEIAAIHAEYEAYLQEKDEIANLNANLSDINAALKAIFTDASCSELNDTYNGLSDYRIGLAFEAMGLPEEVKDMAIRVKHQTWERDKDATYNRYVRDFRIADYEPYSDCSVWQGITKVGPFGCATNPTGITVKAGDVLYVYVGDDVKDNDAELKLEILDDTNRAGTRSQALHKGLNTYQAPHNGEVFVFYNVKNPNKYVYAAKGHEADYPNIRVHIEGGQATGMWDAHRGMTDEQWDWLCDNMFGAKFLHIKGNNTVIHCVTNNVRTAKRLTDVMKIYDFIFMTEERLIGHDGQWDGRYKPVMCYRDGYSGNPNWGGGSVNIPGIGEGSLNYNSLMNERWVIYHEEAHGHQYPVNLAATTESSNNGFAQMVNHEFGVSSRRGNGVKTLVDFKNNGWGWVDMLRGGEGTSRTEGFKYYGDCVWAQNHMFYQLYLYFHVAGNMPDFYPRLCDEMRSNGGLIKNGGELIPQAISGSNSKRATLYTEDYLKFALAACEVSQTDLSEFFDAWGFFDYYEDVKVGNEYTGFNTKDIEASGIRFVGDYGSYYLKMPKKSNEEDVAVIEAAKATMKSYTKKAPNLMFIDDHILDRQVSADCFAAQLDPTRIGQDVAFYDNNSKRQGDFGDMAQFTGTNEADGIDYGIIDVGGTKTVMLMGEGLVGVKIYDAEGNLKYIYNTYSFNVSDEVATALQDGTYTLVAALGNDTNLPLAKPGTTKHTMVIYNGAEDDKQTYKVTGVAPSESATKVPYLTFESTTDVPALTGNSMVLLPNDNSSIGLPLSINRQNTFVNIGTEAEPEWQAMYVTLTDKLDYYLPEGDYSVGMLTYGRSNTAGLNSVCLPFDTQASNYGEGVNTYVLKEVGDNSIVFTQTTEVIPAGTFYLVDCGTNDNVWQLGGSELSLIGSPTTDNESSVGSFQNKTIGAGMYKLNSTGTKFGITTDAGKVTAFRGYLNLPESAASGTRQMALNLMEAPIVTGVDEVQTLQPTYATDLQGRTTLTLQRGKTYIINGKKTIAR